MQIKDSTFLRALNLLLCLPMIHYLLLRWVGPYNDFFEGLYGFYIFTNPTLADLLYRPWDSPVFWICIAAVLYLKLLAIYHEALKTPPKE